MSDEAAAKIDENNTEEMIVSDIDDGLGVSTQKKKMIKETILMKTLLAINFIKKILSLNTIITPRALKKTLPKKNKEK